MKTPSIFTYALAMALSTSICFAQAQDAGDDQESSLSSNDFALPVHGDLLPQEESPGMDEGPALGGVPVDGGLSLLLAAGVAYGANKVRRRRGKGPGRISGAEDRHP